MDRPPIDLPDDYDLGEGYCHDGNTITWIAGAILLAVLVVTIFIIWSIHP